MTASLNEAHWRRGVIEVSMQASPEVNLFIIGAMKSGTTSLHKYLNEHPAIFMCEPKEPGFFVEELAWSKGFEWYRSLFSQADGKVILGESSTHYTKLPVYKGVPERIARFNPDARFVYLMRDPVERAISHYWHNVRDMRWGREWRSMLSAIRRDPQYVAFSDYAMQLKPYIDNFGRDRIFVTTFERMVGNPDDALREVFDWLQVDSNFRPEGIRRRWNAAPVESKRVSGFGFLNRLRHSQAWDSLAPMVPRSLRQIGTRMAEKRVDRSSQDVAAVERYLRPLLLEKTEALKVMLGRDFSEWTTLNRR
ncbi:MAG: sulfotransferase family protein [Acidiferrobacterales bacterium]